MSFDPEDYEISIRSVEPSYNHTLPRDTKREDTEHETHLSSITVEVHLRAARSADSDYDQQFAAKFTVDHDPGSVAFRTVGDAYDKCSEFDPEKYYFVSDFAARVVESWLESVGLAYEPPAHSVTMWDNPPKPTVHTEMTVTPSGGQK